MKKAFTIVELMVVILILGLLAALVVPNLVGKSDDAKVKLAGVQIKNLSEAVKLFRIDIGRYPTNEEGLGVLIKKPSDDKEWNNYTKNGYLGGSMPLDPWNREYIYVDNSGDYDIISLGSDGKSGGENDAKDIKLSEIK